MKKKTTCKDHTPNPSGYLQFHAWAEMMQERGAENKTPCDGCGLFAIWRDKKGIVRRRVEVDCE